MKILVVVELIIGVVFVFGYAVIEVRRELLRDSCPWIRASKLDESDEAFVEPHTDAAASTTMFADLAALGESRQMITSVLQLDFHASRREVEA